MVEWNELHKKLSSGDIKIEWVTEDSEEYKVMYDAACYDEAPSANFWLSTWRQKVAVKGNYGSEQNQPLENESATVATQNMLPVWTIDNHDFEEAKNRIKEFSEEEARKFDFRRVDETKSPQEIFFGILTLRDFSTKKPVYGEDLNYATSQIQNHLVSIHDTQIKLTQEFGQVYNALEALDKDYIQAILLSIKATEETSEAIKDKQKQIDELVGKQKSTLEALVEFKDKLKGYSHIEDVDKIWKLTEENQRCLDQVEQEVTENIAEVKQTTNVAIDALTRKVKYAYWFAGGSACFAVIELILLLMQVI